MNPALIGDWLTTVVFVAVPLVFAYKAKTRAGRVIGVAVAVLLVAAYARAGDYNAQREARQANIRALNATNRLTCWFGPGAAADWSDKRDPFVTLFMPRVEILKRGMPAVDVRGINRRAGVATMVGNNGNSDVRVEWGGDTLTFYEVAGAGPRVTTVFATENGLVAVHSRHTSVFGPPMAETYYGRCSTTSRPPIEEIIK